MEQNVHFDFLDGPRTTSSAVTAGTTTSVTMGAAGTPIFDATRGPARFTKLLNTPTFHGA